MSSSIVDPTVESTRFTKKRFLIDKPPKYIKVMAIAHLFDTLHNFITSITNVEVTN